MRPTLIAIACAALMACNISPPNGVFGCFDDSECPPAMFCWDNNRCYDSAEPTCEPDTCAQALAKVAQFNVECGELDDGCGGTISCDDTCPDDTVCGANGLPFNCGCEETSCAAVGAQCGELQLVCSSGTIQCQPGCQGELTCDPQTNTCVCPAGVQCGGPCGGCQDGEICVAPNCCALDFPCSRNECSPPGGLPNGCGGMDVCNPCDNNEECEPGNGGLYTCVNQCTCDAQGIECGVAEICGRDTSCGSCAMAGFPGGFRCQSGRCVCADEFEPNDSLDRAVGPCEGGGYGHCNRFAQLTPPVSFSFGLEDSQIPATLHTSRDEDWYRVPLTVNSFRGIAEMKDSEATFTMLAACTAGNPIVECSKGTSVRVSDDLVGCLGPKIDLRAGCTSLVGTSVVILVATSLDFPGECTAYQGEVQLRALGALPGGVGVDPR